MRTAYVFDRTEIITLVISFFFSSRRRHTISNRDWSSDVCSSDLSVRGAGPWDIAVGSDDALWFTELDGNRIGRITTGGVTTTFDLPSQDDGPIGIANGPDGALWFTNSH